jgi:CheY-like chemotaxis protein
MSGAGRTVVLVVEDEPLVRMSIADHLADRGSM